MNRNLVGSIYWRSFIKLSHFIPIRLQTAAAGNSFFWLVDSKKSLPLKPLGQMNWHLVGSIYGMSSIKISHLFRSVNKYGRHRQFLFMIGLFFFKSSRKPIGQMYRNLVGSIYGISSIKIAHFVAIRWQTWPPQAILVSDWFISKKSSPL